MIFKNSNIVLIISLSLFLKVTYAQDLTLKGKNKKDSEIINYLESSDLDRQNDSLLVEKQQNFLYALKQNVLPDISKSAMSLLDELRSQGEWIELIKKGNLAINALSKSENLSELALITDEMLYGYIFLGDNRFVQERTKEMIGILKNPFYGSKYYFEISLLYLTSGRAFGNSGQYENADKQLKYALNYAKKIKDSLQEHLILVDMTSNYLKLKRFDEALKYSLECKKYFEEQYHNRALSETYMLLGNSYLNLKKYKEAIKYSIKVSKTANHRILASTNETLYEAYKNIGQFEKSINALEQYIKSKDKLFNEKLANEKTSLETNYLKESSRSLIEAEKLKLKQQIQLRNTFIISALLLLIFTIVLFRIRSKLKSQNKKIHIQNETIEELNQNLEKKVEERTLELKTALNEIQGALQKGQRLERKRMAADLHDNLGSMLTAINISLDMIDPELLLEKERKIYENTVKIAEEAYNEVRLISHNLMPDKLEKKGLIISLKSLIDKLNNSQKIVFSLEANEDEYIPKNIILNLYSICLEVFQNILKHSDATKAFIRLQSEHDNIILTIEDNGKGSSELIGFGTDNIKSRILEMNGKWKLQSVQPHGIKYHIQIPMKS